MRLESYRRQIDLIDAEIIALLIARQDLAREIGVVKASAGLPIEDGRREADVLRHVGIQSEGSATIISIYRTILDESRRLQTSEAEKLINQTV